MAKIGLNSEKIPADLKIFTVVIQLRTPVDYELFPSELLIDHRTVERKWTYMRETIGVSKEREREREREKEREREREVW